MLVTINRGPSFGIGLDEPLQRSRAYGIDHLGSDSLRLTGFHADHGFFHAIAIPALKPFVRMLVLVLPA